MGPGASETLRKVFLAELDGEEANPTTVEVIMGRKLHVRSHRVRNEMFYPIII